MMKKETDDPLQSQAVWFLETIFKYKPRDVFGVVVFKDTVKPHRLCKGQKDL